MRRGAQPPRSATQVRVERWWPWRLSVSFCSVAWNANWDRSIQTPTSIVAASATQRVEQAEEDRLVRIVRQHPIHDSPCLFHNLARDRHHRVDERLELDAQQPGL